MLAFLDVVSATMFCLEVWSSISDVKEQQYCSYHRLPMTPSHESAIKHCYCKTHAADKHRQRTHASAGALIECGSPECILCLCRCRTS